MCPFLLKGIVTRLSTLYYDYPVIQWENSPFEQRDAPKVVWLGGVEICTQLPPVPLALWIFPCPM